MKPVRNAPELVVQIAEMMQMSCHAKAGIIREVARRAAAMHLEEEEVNRENTLPRLLNLLPGGIRGGYPCFCFFGLLVKGAEKRFEAGI